ncbi:cupin domain-containing protein [Variovorax sp. J2P1-59]|uniref:cupin domain-containing protein n=1 Tax=Variovorax flavidus TaxID=3053501 RepID=UPI002575790E|nr:cupin domain-containing protein [Variovorax sp. J2P1-59]MDM0074769.1 cupin domain-containing protein [Variovorax sp. J2P1-59]
MFTTARHIGTTLLVAAGALMAQEASAHGAAHDAVVTPLLARELANISGKEVLVMTVDYAPGDVEPVHRHDAHGFIYVLEGSIEMGLKGGKVVTLQAGDTFYEGPHDIHTVGRNASKVWPAKFLVFLVKNTASMPSCQ